MAAIKTTKFKLENEEYDKIQAASISGDLLHSIGLSYFAQLDMFHQLLERKSGVKSTRMTSVGITAIELDIKYLFGMPRTASAGGLSIDVDRNLHTIQAIDGDSEKVKAYNIVTGQISSYLEGGVFQQIFGGEAVSTMHILQKANMQGIKIYHINQENADSIIPQLQYNTAKKQMFRNLVNSGKEITVPEKNVTFGDWTGTGFIALNPEKGTGTYMIDGGLSGGRTDDTVTATPWLDFLLITILLVGIILILPYIVKAIAYSIVILSIMASSGYWAQLIVNVIISMIIALLTIRWEGNEIIKAGICGGIGYIITELLKKLWEAIILSSLFNTIKTDYIYCRYIQYRKILILGYNLKGA